MKDRTRRTYGKIGYCEQSTSTHAFLSKEDEISIILTYILDFFDEKLQERKSSVNTSCTLSRKQ